MFVDLNELEDGATVNADIGIIGGGAAGITLAMEMIGAGIDVALIESGGFEYDSETQALYEGEIAGLDYFPLDATRLRYFGGTTNHWGGQSLPLEPIDFAARDWVPDSGWPITYEEFARYLPRAETLCRLTLAEADQAVWELGPEMPEFPLAETGFEPVLLRFPVPTFSFGSVYRRTIETAERVTCYLNANALELDTDPAGRRIEAVRLASLAGRRARLRAGTYVLAAGGIENCRILLSSRRQGSERRGLGNDHDLVGRYFMEHPNYDSGPVSMAFSPYLSRHRDMIGTQSVKLEAQLSAEAQAEARILNHSAYLSRQPRSRRERLWARLAGRFGAEPEDPYVLRVRLEQAPRPESRVRLGEATDALGMPRVELDLRVGELEARTVAHVSEAFARALGMTDLGRMQITFDPATDAWQNELSFMHHHCGGTRMHDDPSRGVVDADCKVHGIDNLYVTGASVFPTSGHANPTMNLLALTIRLADHLKSGGLP